MKRMITITKLQARRFILSKQGLIGKYRFIGKDGAYEYIRQAGCIQYDPVDVCGKNAELTLQSRVKGFQKEMLRELLYKDRLLVDYADKELSIWPTEGKLMKRFYKGILFICMACMLSSCSNISGQETGTAGGNSETAKESITDGSDEADGSYDERLDEILADSKEIERKWLIRPEDIPYDLNGAGVYQYDIQQTYISFEPEIRVRNYNEDSAYELTVKTNLSADGLIRDEVNMSISREEYYNLILKKEGNTIHKTRYQFYADHQLIAIDIFHGDLEGLAYMEIEFASKAESDAYATPEWVIADVTDDISYKNGHLARYGIPDAYGVSPH